MAEQERKLAAGEDYRRAVKPAWAIVTVQGILDNDFYIGTLRQGKYTRKKINGKDVRRDEIDHIILEHHHQEIIDYRTFATAHALRESRSTAHYRGQKKYDNTYSGFLECGDCGSPMFAMSRRDLSLFIDIQRLQRIARNVPVDLSGTLHHREITYPSQ